MEYSTIEKIVKASGVSTKELVLVQFWGEDKDVGIMHMFAKAVASLGASPIELQQSRTVNADKFAVTDHDAFSEAYFQVISRFDAVLDVFCYRPAVLDIQLNEAQTDLYRRYVSTLFQALSSAKRFTQIRIPTPDNAAESNLPADEYIKRMNAAYDIDYADLEKDGKKLIATMQETLTLKTSETSRLHFRTTGRKWHLDAGDGDMPCGEIYIAPIETETYGQVFFKTLYADDWGVFDNVTLVVESGVVVSSDNTTLNGHFADLKTADKTVCELGFGLNPNVTSLCGYTLLDEKACGTFHIAIGMNTMFGGINTSSMHMDFVGTAMVEQGG